MYKEIKSLRWVLLAVGIVAVIAITGMNVYSLYTLRNSSIETARQSKKIQVAEFSDRIRYRFFKPFYGLRSVEMKKLEEAFNRTGQFSKKPQHVIYKASQDSIFDAIYYIPARANACKSHGKLLRFDTRANQFKPVEKYSSVVCDAIGIARTRMRSLIRDYRYNNKVLFDTHRSMAVALVNQKTQSVIGYLAMPINYSYMVNHYLQPKLENVFGPDTDSNLNVWLRDWTNGRIIARSNPNKRYKSDDIEFRQKFPDLFDDWKLYVSFVKGPIAASTPSLWKNLFILAAAFIFLIGAMLFMFFTAQRERALAERQSDFLANVTHELKTPISVMQAAGENLSDGRINTEERLKSYGSHIYNEAVRLQKMIDRLLDVAKADAGQSFIRPKPIAINKKVERFLSKHRSYIEEKGFTLDTNLTDHISRVMIDEHSLDTILSNLVNNAIKYSNGNKFLGLYLTENDDEVKIKIEDHGVGMNKKSMNHIFEKFYRAEDPLTAKTKGYGLGLSIVKNLVNLNGGRISVRSKEGKGTTFILSFPAISDTDEAGKISPPSTNKIASSIN